MVANAAGTKGQPSIQVPLLSSFQSDFRVLNDLVMAIHFAHDADGFGWECFFYNLKSTIKVGIFLLRSFCRQFECTDLGSTISPLKAAVSNECWVSHLHKNVIHAVDMN